MKKVIKTMMMMLVASAFVLTSCKDSTDPEDVVLTLNPAKSSGVHFVGDILTIVVNGKGNSDNKLKNLKITRAPEGKPTETITNEKLSGTDKIYNLKDTFDLSDTVKITYTIVLEGEKNTQTATYVATVKAVNPIDVTPSNLSLRGQTQSADHFMQLTAPFSLYSVDATDAQWKEEVDLAYFYGTTNKHSITSPSNTTMQGLFQSANFASSFSQSRVTGFYRMPAADNAVYQTIITDDDDRALVTYADGKTFTDNAFNLVNGETVLFKTKEGALGMFRVFSLTGTAAAEAEMQFRVIVQHK